MVKRVFDIAVALIGLIVLAPVFVVIAILIKLDLSGPVFFKGKRVGQHGKIFYMLKFRSMVVDAPQKGPAITCKDDPRVTRMGRFLRKTKLDELPGLVNVLKGEMSLVGPRPEVPAWVERYTPRQRAVLTARPGITGLTQVKYRHEEELLSSANLEAEYLEIMNDKLNIDLDYVENHSFILDLYILIKTAAALVRRSYYMAVVVALSLALVVSCVPTETPTPTLVPTLIGEPTETVVPTDVPRPTNMPTSTVSRTPEPTDTVTPAPQRGAIWHGVVRTNQSDWGTVRTELGAQVVEMLVRPSTADAEILAGLDAAQEMGLLVLLHIHDRDQPTSVPFSPGAGVTPRGAEILRLVEGHPAVWAVYAFEEPFDYTSAGHVTPDQQRELYTAIKAIADVPLYSDLSSISRAEREGLTLSDGMCDICCVAPGWPRDPTARLNAEVSTWQRLMPNAQLVVMVNTYDAGARYVMPTAEQIRSFRSQLCALDLPYLYYPWQHGSYTRELQDVPDLWPVIAEGCGSSPSPTATPRPTPAADSIVIDHSAVDAGQIPQQWLDVVRGRSHFFTHKSIGNNVLDGIGDLAKQNPGRYSIAVNYSAGTGAGINEYQTGRQELPVPWYGIVRAPVNDWPTIRENLGGSVVDLIVYPYTPLSDIIVSLDSAEALEYQVVFHIYDDNTNTNKPWYLDADGQWVFPQSAIDMLQAVSDHPTLLAIYALHEPLDEGAAYVSVEQQRELYQLIKQHTDGLPVWTDIGGLSVWEDRGIELTDGICDYCRTGPSHFRSDWSSEQCLTETLRRIDADFDVQQRLMPNSQVVFAINTYSFSDYRYPIRLPTPYELGVVRDYLCDLDQPMLYHPWHYSAYDATLEDAPELWPVIAEGCSYTLDKAVDQTEARVGDTLVYTLTVDNGGGMATAFLVTDTLDADTSFAGFLGTSPGSYGHAAGVITWTGTVSGMRQVQLAFQATISASAWGAVTNTAHLDDGAGGVYSDTVTTFIVAGNKLYLPAVLRDD